MQQLDFSAFEGPRPKPIRSELTDIHKTKSSHPALLALGAIALLIVFGLSLQRNNIIIVLAIIGLFYYILSRGTETTARLSNFAVMNGFRFKISNKGGKGIAQLKLDGVLGDNTSILVMNQIIGKYDDFSFRLFSTFQENRYTIMRVELRNDYPHIILDSTKNNPLFSSVNRYFSDKEKLTLEGDFQDHFIVYTKADPIDSLRILSPDMMALLIDTAHDYDIELVGTSLHIIGNFIFARKEDVAEFFTIADTLLNKLDRRKATVRADFDSTKRLN